ncbi:hypothetical protein AB3S75_031060 [Citrus x aurantiifolia]
MKIFSNLSLEVALIQHKRLEIVRIIRLAPHGNFKQQLA